MRPSGIVLATLALAACSSQDTTAPMLDHTPLTNQAGQESAGAVYTLTNQASNAIRAFARDHDGTLTFVADYPTGGAGSGGGLGSQAALAFGRGQTLLAVNAASNEITALRISHAGLSVINSVASGGVTPISVTSHHGVVYVLNAGAPANISGFRQDAQGYLSPIAGSTRALSVANPAPAQVSFSPRGDFLVVTEKGTNNILTFHMAADDTPGTAQVNASVGATPFGFAFLSRGDYLIVSEAFGGAANASASSSYRLGDLGNLNVRTASLFAGQTAACWIAVTPDNKFAYATNTGSNTVTGYRVAGNGTLTLLDPSGITATVSGSALDASASRNGRFLYVLGGSSGTIDGYAIAADGSLSPLGAVSGLPAGSVGLLAR